MEKLEESFNITVQQNGQSLDFEQLELEKKDNQQGSRLGIQKDSPDDEVTKENEKDEKIIASNFSNKKEEKEENKEFFFDSKNNLYKVSAKNLGNSQTILNLEEEKLKKNNSKKKNLRN